MMDICVYKYKLYKQGGAEICLCADSGLMAIKTSVNIILTDNHL